MTDNKIYKAFGWGTILGIVLLTPQRPATSETLTSAFLGGWDNRTPANRKFPQVREKKDEDDILEYYPAYLNFILEIGNLVNRPVAHKINQMYYSNLKKHPAHAAAFLKGLRFEILQKVQMAGMNPDELSTRNPEMKKWVTKYLPIWLREIDEHWFRARTELAQRKSEDGTQREALWSP